MINDPEKYAEEHDEMTTWCSYAAHIKNRDVLRVALLLSRIPPQMCNKVVVVTPAWAQFFGMEPAALANGLYELAGCEMVELVALRGLHATVRIRLDPVPFADQQIPGSPSEHAVS